MVCNDCFILPANPDTGLCCACEVNHQVHAAQASNNPVQKVYYKTIRNLTDADVKTYRVRGWEPVSGTPQEGYWRLDLSNIETGSAA